MKVVQTSVWIFYIDEKARFDSNKIGKWMYFFNNKEFAEKLCRESVENNIVREAKHNNDEKGVACFYLNYDDVERHKRILSYFLKNDLMRRTNKGRLYNISFKLDNQTLAGEYGRDFRSDIKLSNFINLDTEEWLI